MASRNKDEIALKKQKGLRTLLFVGFVTQAIVMFIFLLIVSKGGALDTPTDTSGGVNFGGPWIFALLFFINLPLLASAILVTLRSAFSTARVLLIVSIITSIPIGTFFALIGLVKLSKAKRAFPGMLERIEKRQKAKKKLKGKTEILELECPDCGNDFKIKDKGKRPLAIKCPHCGVEGEI